MSNHHIRVLTFQNWVGTNYSSLSCRMKSRELRDVILSKLQNGQGPAQISRDLNGKVSTRTIERWSKSVREEGSLVLRLPPGRPRSARTRAVVRSQKYQVKPRSL